MYIYLFIYIENTTSRITNLFFSITKSTTFFQQRPPATLPKPFRGDSFRQLQQVENDQRIYAECNPQCPHSQVNP